MTITTAPAAAADLAVCCVVPPELIGWDRYDWLESYADDSYERSVIWAADDNCRLAPIVVEALFRAHVADLEEYRRSLAVLGAAHRETLGRHLRAMAAVGVAGLVEPGARLGIGATALVPAWPPWRCSAWGL